MKSLINRVIICTYCDESCRHLFDEKLCQEIPEIDVILGVIHTIICDEGEMNNGVLMAGGKYGYYLGEVNLTIENKKVVSARLFIRLKHYLWLKQIMSQKERH